MDHERYLQHAARLALRGHGGAEPNPMVGCVIVNPQGETVGWGYHRSCGQAHAEIRALKRAGARARGATAYVTLEPCNHSGRTGPCAQALIDAGIHRVVIARSDPHHEASGGTQRLRSAGVQVLDIPHAAAASVSDPFVHRVMTDLPWVIVKWAQTLDGKIATRCGESQWISSEVSRRLVHRERGRVCAILTGIGTVNADDPLLTARHVRRRRVARRVVVDPSLQIDEQTQLVATSHLVPTTIVCAQSAAEHGHEKAHRLRRAQIEILALPAQNNELSLQAMLRELVQRHEVTNVLVEAGSGLVSRLFQQQLVNEAWVFVSPLLLGDDAAPAAVAGRNVHALADGTALKLVDQRRRGSDVVLRYRVST